MLHSFFVDEFHTGLLSTCNFSSKNFLYSNKQSSKINLAIDCIKNSKKKTPPKNLQLEIRYSVHIHQIFFSNVLQEQKLIG